MMNKKLCECGNLLNKCAQEIAESTSEIIDYDIIITDIDGRIVGASHSDRLGQFHEASLEVIRSGAGTSTERDKAIKLRGTLPGVTYPIVGLHGRIVGSMALTGNPEKVRPFALIVKKQIEILLRERELYSYSNNKEQILQNFIQDLASFVPGVSNETMFTARAVDLGYNISRLYVPIAVDLYQFGRYAMKIRRATHGGREAETRLLNTRKAILTAIRAIFTHPGDISTISSNNRFAILHVITGKFVREEVEKSAEQLVEELKKFDLKAAIGIGSPARGIAEMAISYGEAWKALRLGKKFHQKPGIYCISDFRLEDLVATIDTSVRGRYVSSVIGTVLAQTDSDELLETLREWCESGFSLIEASRNLHIHRNTLIYRLDKLSRMLGVNVRKFRICFNLYFALILRQYAGPATQEKE